MIRFHWGGQVSADIQAQNQMLFDAMTPEAKQRVLAAQAERAAAEARVEAEQKAAEVERWKAVAAELDRPEHVRRRRFVRWAIAFVFLAATVITLFKEVTVGGVV